MTQTVMAMTETMAPEYVFFARVGLAALFVLAGLYGARLVHPLVTGAAHRIKLRVPEWLHLLVQGFTAPAELLLRVLLVYLAVWIAPLPDACQPVISKWMGPLSRATVVFLGAWGFWRSAPLCHLMLRSAQNSLDLRTNQTLGRFFENMFRVLVVVFALLIVLDMFGVPVASLVAGAGIAGLAISLAAQSTLTNLIAGVTLVLEHPFGIGDFIILGDVQGTVEDISFRSTRLRTADNVAITVENSKVCSEYIQNANDRSSRLWTFTLRLPYETTAARLDAACDALRELLAADAQIRGETVVVTVDSIGEGGIELLVRAYTNTANYMDYLQIRDRLNRGMLSALEALGCAPLYAATSLYVSEKGAIERAAQTEKESGKESEKESEKE